MLYAALAGALLAFALLLLLLLLLFLVSWYAVRATDTTFGMREKVIVDLLSDGCWHQGRDIRRHVEGYSGSSFDASVYSILSRLQHEGLVESLEDPTYATPERGGRSVFLYRLKPSCLEAASGAGDTDAL